MAIHVRATNTVKIKVASLIRRMLSIALGLALISILISALVLYVMKIYTEAPGSSSFVTYTPPVKKTEDTSRKKYTESTAAESSANAAAPSAVILSDTSPYVVSLPTSFDDMSAGLDGEDGLAGIGFGDMGLGDGFGDGIGMGDGGGDGDGGGGNGGKRAGYNDDIQVVLLLDASGSMQTLFTAASESMEKVLTALSNAKLNGKKTKVNVGIVVYGQGAQNGAPMKLSPFTTQVKKIRSRLEKVACDGALENCGEAIAFAVHNFEWNRRDRDDMLKVIFIAGNEPFDQGPINYQNAIAEATAQHIIVNTIHCGPPDTEWEEAAALGHGVGLTLDIQQDGGREVSEDEIHQTLQALHNCKPLPIGAPAVQRKYIDMLNKAAAPPKGNPKQLSKWLRDNKRRILQGYDWDAIELYRCAPQGEFSIDMLGGPGNLPISMRGKSEEEIIDFLSQEAERRTRLLELYKAQKASGDLGDKLLNVLQEQAQEKGITIDF